MTAVTDTSSGLVCTAPPRSGAPHPASDTYADAPYMASDGSGRALISLLCDGARCGDALSFDYVPNVTLLQLWPTAGPIDGGTRVTLVGRRLFDTGRVRCQFGHSTAVIAHLFDASHYVCVSPRPPHSGVAALRLSLNGQQFYDYTPGNTLTFGYHATPTLYRVHPSRAPLHGGTTLILVGSALHPAAGSGPRRGMEGGIVVRFDDVTLTAGPTSVVGTALADGTVRCTTPTLSAGAIGISLSTNHGIPLSPSLPLPPPLRPTTTYH